MGYMLKANTGWGPMYYSDSIEGTVDKKKAAVFDSEDEARKFLKTFDWLILKDIKHDKVEIVKESHDLKPFRQYLVESASSEELNDLRDEINLLPKSSITRSTNKGFYVSVDCKRDYDGTYEVTDRMATELNGLTSSWNRRHTNRIDWEMPNEKKDEVYIYFK